MRKFIWAVLAALCICSAAWAQGNLFQDSVLRPTAVIAGASVRVCQKAATGTPCSPLETIYSDEALTTVIAGSIVTADTRGNFQFYSAASCVQLQMSAAGFSTLTVPACSPNTSTLAATQVVTFSATPTFDTSASQYFRMTLTSNVTSSTLGGAVTGRVAYFNLCQDATGGRTFAWPAAVLNAPTIGTAASSCTSVSLIYDGTNWRELAPTSRGSAVLDTLTVGNQNNILFVDGVKYAQTAAGIQAAIDALPATGGTVILPRGVTSISSTLTLDNGVSLVGQGTGLGQRGTNLQWTGGASPAILISAVEAASVKNLSINNTGTGTIAIDIDAAASNTLIEDVFIDSPSTKFNPAIRIGNATGGNPVILPTLRRVFIRDNTGGLQVLRANHVVLEGVRLWLNDNYDLQIGDATHPAVSVRSLYCDYEGQANGTAIVVNNAESASFDHCYFESDGTGYVLDIPATATLASNIVISHSRFKGASFGNSTTYVTNVNLSSATLSITSSFADGYASPSYFVRNQAARKLFLADLYSATTNPADAYSTNSEHFGNFLGANTQGARLQGTLASPVWFQNALVRAKRYTALDGTALVAGDFALSAGWGTSPSVSPAATDMGGRVTVTSGTGTPTANPTVALTFKDGTWTTAPGCVVSRGDTNTPTGDWRLTSITATVATWTFVATPDVSTAYIFDFKCEGKP